jgi:hypothetical protein
MNDSRPGFLGLVAKTVAVHTLTYFLMGILALTFVNCGGYHETGTSSV